MAWPNNPRPAGSLVELREQINSMSPNRNKASDGLLGDAAHQAEGSASDHNPNTAGVVTAMDITNDPSQGVDVQKIADSIAASQDPRVKYMIFNDRIMIPSDYGWKWVAHYVGSHRQHLHVSVWGNYDDKSNWSIGTNKEENEVIPTRDLLNALFVAFRGRKADDTEADRFIGKTTYNDLIPSLNDGSERQEVAQAYEKGKVAIKDNWEGQIWDNIAKRDAAYRERDAAVQERNDALKNDAKYKEEIKTKDVAINDLKAQLAVQSDDTKNLNSLGQALQWAIKRLGLK